MTGAGLVTRLGRPYVLTEHVNMLLPTLHVPKMARPHPESGNEGKVLEALWRCVCTGSERGLLWVELAPESCKPVAKQTVA